MSSKSAATSGSKKAPLGETIPIRLSPRTYANIGFARETMGLKDQEVIRLAAEIGLAVLAGIKYDPATLIAKFALENQLHGTAYQMREQEPLMAAEDPATTSDERETAKALEALHAQDRTRQAKEAAGKKANRAAHK